MMGTGSGTNKRQRNRNSGRRNDEEHSAGSSVHTNDSDEESGDEEIGKESHQWRHGNELSWDGEQQKLERSTTHDG